MQVIGSMPMRSISQSSLRQSSTIFLKSFGLFRYSPGMPGTMGATEAVQEETFMPSSSMDLRKPATFSGVMGT